MVTATGSTVNPVEHIAGVPVFKHGTAPAHLRTRSQLYAGLRLTLAPGQQPECWVIPYFHPDERRALYDPADAVPVPDQSPGAVWAWRARRTCPKCGAVREYVVHGSQCGACWRKEQAKLTDKRERRCDDCKRLGDKPYPKVHEGWTYKRLCRACRAAFNRKLNALLAETIRCPGGCGKRTATKKQILDWAVANHYSITRWARRYCAPCNDIHQAEKAERDAEQRARWEKARAEGHAREVAERQARRQELADLRDWAIGVLADPATVILDTETTGLHDAARIVDIAVTTATGETLLDTLVNPGEPIPADATAIHGITDDMVAAAPTFANIAGGLLEVLKGRRVIIYNAQYDMARLAHEYSLLCDTEAEAAAVAEAVYVGNGGVNSEDAMEPYGTWYGDWSDWHGNYRWQPLGGGHRAHGDCLAVIDCLKAMTRPSVYEEEDQ